ATTRLDDLARRLAFDPELRIWPEMSSATVVELGGGFADDSFRLSDQEWSFVAEILGPTSIGQIAERAGLPVDSAVQIATALTKRGLIEPLDT
ncbi:MAG: hypothetical protein ACOC9Y_04730, partial [Chloroflexota bacterium]